MYYDTVLFRMNAYTNAFFCFVEQVGVKLVVKTDEVVKDYINIVRSFCYYSIENICIGKKTNLRLFKTELNPCLLII